MPTVDSTKLENCILSLHDIGVVKFGNFTLKSGMQSPVYFDLRMVISFPKILKTVSELLWSAVPSDKKKNYDHICGVAYTGIPLATIIAAESDMPMLMRRKETKSYGTKKLVEGIYNPNDCCLIIEDVLVSGASVYETVETLRELELIANDAVVFLDREQGGVRNLTELGVNIIPVVTLSKMMDVLLKHERVQESTVKDVAEFISTHNKTSISTKPSEVSVPSSPTNCRLTSSFTDRIAFAKHPLNKKLFSIMHEKCTNLCVAADVSTAAELLRLADCVGPHICTLKAHVDILEDFTPEVAQELRNLAGKHNFLLFEDRKFVDIGNTVCRQYQRSGSWADLVTIAPVLAGDGVLKGIEEAVKQETQDKGVILVAEMSCEGALRSDVYVKSCRKMAEDFPTLAMGFVCQSSITSDPGMLQFTPGVSMTASSDALGQRYVRPKVAVTDRGADVVIVGRAITKATDPAKAAEEHKLEAYDAYLSRCLKKN